jgi:hypothetical protein
VEDVGDERFERDAFGDVQKRWNMSMEMWSIKREKKITVGP